MKNSKIILLKGNGPISINNELLELYAVTTCHGAIGFPLKSLRADRIYFVRNIDEFWEIEKTIKDKPCCFIYSYEHLDEEDLSKIHSAEKLNLK
ncbi:hypothetical protein [Halarcobacter sp.]|uniref:hypothetical protein n=1 Tax=Halarcobacter sp. TaxID=2321133 RepID=UPI002AA8BBCF|nr:hypothetical protein [Halarcobacter sp.]